MNNFEDKLKHYANNQKEFVDTDALWNAVEPHLEESKRRRLIPFLLLFGLFTIVMWIGYNSFHDTEMKSLQTIASNNTANKISALIPTAEADKNFLASTKEYNTNQEAIPVPQQQEASNKIRESRSSGSFITNATESVQFESSNVRKSESQNKTVLTTTLSRSTGNDSPSHNESKQAVDNGLELKSILKTDLQSPTSNKANASIAIDKLLINKLIAAVVLPIAHAQPAKKNLIQTSIPWSFYLSGGLSQSPLSIGLKNPEWQNHYFNRFQNETSLLSWHVRAGLKYEISGDWNLNGGLRLSSFNRRSSTQLMTSETITLDNVITEQIIGPNGVEDIYGSVQVLQQTTKSVERISKSTSIDLYFLLQRKLQLSDQFSIGIGAGASYNLNLSQSGLIHPIENQEYDISIDSEEWFRSTLGLGIETIIDFNFSVSDHLDLMLYGNYSHPLKGIDSDIYGLTESRNTYHFGISTQYNF